MVPDKDFLKQVESEMLRVTINNLKMGKVSEARVRESAKYFLTFLPFSSYSDLVNKLEKFTKIYPEYKRVYLFANKFIEETKTKDLIERMRKHIKKGEIDQAVQLASKTKSAVKRKKGN